MALSDHEIITNGSAGYKGNKWIAILSGNYQHRDRSQTSYFEYWRNQEIERGAYMVDMAGDTVTNLSSRFPDPSLAMEKSAGNVFIGYGYS